MYRTHTCGELRPDNISDNVTLSGWVQRSRDLGGLTFVDLRDRYGITQLVFDLNKNEKLCMAARKLGREFVVQVEGNVPMGDADREVAGDRTDVEVRAIGRRRVRDMRGK